MESHPSGNFTGIGRFRYNPAMRPDLLSQYGEFVSLPREAEFQSEHLPESLRHVRLIFLYALILNTLFLVSDWRFFGQPHFYAAISARASIFGASLACLLIMGGIADFRRFQRICAAWAGAVIVAGAVLVSPPSDIALLVIFVLPTLFYLALPVSARWTLVLGLGCSIATVAAHMASLAWENTNLGLMLGMLLLNVVLALVRRWSDRLRRLEWMATRAEHAVNKELSEHRETLQRILAAVPTPLVIFAREGRRLIQANEAAHRYFGDEILKESLVLETLLDHRDLARLAETLHLTGQVTEFETRLHLADGSQKDVLLAVTTLLVRGTQAILAVLVDITSRKEMEAHLQRLATTDPLTGLANRGRFFAVAGVELRRAQRYQRPLAVLMIDIDLFKRINDAYGHETGDLALTAFAGLCRNLIRDHDVAARWGGEEFALLLPETDPPNAMAVADRLRSAVEELRLDGLPARMTISVGVSEVSPEETTMDAALSRADQALYVAKRSGRNRSILYDRAGSSMSARTL
jgi:diguanylate cyclase (GGDEF)-like protein/PAS domain S-box-containing protein